jgi:DNA-binding transcriptional regulator YhcF (GntR family)
MTKPTWRKPSGAPVSCTEKIKVLNENYEELRALAQETLDDALLMGCSEQQIRQILRDMMDGLAASYDELPD